MRKREDQGEIIQHSSANRKYSWPIRSQPESFSLVRLCRRISSPGSGRRTYRTRSFLYGLRTQSLYGSQVWRDPAERIHNDVPLERKSRFGALGTKELFL